MAGKAYTQTINFKGTFDASNVLKSLKDIRSSMAKAGADSNLFKNVDKDIASTEKLITEMLAQIQKGFSNPQELNTFQKNFDKLGLSLSKINVGLQDINKAGNFNMNFGEIQKLSNEIDQLAAKQESLKKSAKDSVAAQLSKISTTAKERQAIMDQIEAEGDLEEAIKKVAQAREQAAKARNYKKGLETDTGQAVIAEEANNVNASDFGLSAMSGRSKMGTKDARTRKSGHITGLDEAKAAQVFAESYQKTLEEVLKNGGNAIDAVNLMKKSMNDYGVEISEEDKLLDSFSSSIDNFTNKALSDSQRKGIKTGQSLGSTDDRGNFNFSEAGKELANNESYQAMQENTRRQIELQEQLSNAVQVGEARNAQVVGEHSQALERAANNEKKFGEEAQSAIDATREQTEVMNDINSTFDRMGDAVKTFLSIGSAINMMKSAIRDTFEDIKSLDKSFANIAMVTDYSVQDMWNSYDQYAQMANELGQSTQSVIEASGLYYQQGLDTNESLELTQDTMKLATLAGLDFSEATSQMTAALRGFKMEMDEGERVTDVYAELAAKAAADVEGIATAMSKTASIASSAGMEFETTSAFLTQMIETTQEAPTNIGTAMKTIIARFTELKENVAGTADSEFDDLDYNKVDTALKSVGVSLKDASGQFRDLDDVFLELAGKWDTLDRNSQRYIATIAAGARQQSRFIAMMDNYDRTMELVNVAYDSNGKAAEQFGKYSDTLEYKLNKLTNTWEQMRLKFLKSEFLKGAVDSLNELLKKVQNFDAGDFLKLGAVWLTLGKSAIQNFIKGAQASAASVQKIFSNIFSKIPKISFKTSDAKMQLNSLKNQINTLGDTVTTLDGKEITIKAKYEGLSVEELKNKLNSDDISDDERSYINARISEEEKSAIIKEQESIWGSAASAASQAFSASFTAGITALTLDESPGKTFATSFLSGATTSLTSGMSAFNNAISSGLSALQGFKSGVISGIVSIGVSALTAAVPALISWHKELEKERDLELASASAISSKTLVLKELEEEHEKLNDKYNEENDKLSEQQEEYDKLSSTIESYTEINNKLFLGNEDRQELLEIQEQLIDLAPDLVDYYDSEGNAIINNTEKLEEYIEMKKEELALQKKATLDAQIEKESNEFAQSQVKASQDKATANTMKKYESTYRYFSTLTTKNSQADLRGRVVEKQGDETTVRDMIFGDFKNSPNLRSATDFLYTIVEEADDNFERNAEDIKEAEQTIAAWMQAIKYSDKDLYDTITEGEEGLSGIELAGRLKEYIDIGDTEQEKDNLERVNEAIGKYYDDIEKITSESNKELEAKKKQLNKTIDDMMTVQGELNSDFKEYDKNTQDLILSGAKAKGGLSNDITQSFYEQIAKTEKGKDWFIYDENGVVIDVKPDLSEEDTNALIDEMDRLTKEWSEDSSQYIKDMMNSLEPGDISKIEAIYTQAEEKGWSWLEIVNEFKDQFGNNTDVLGAVTNRYAEQIETYNDLLIDTATKVGDEVPTTKDNLGILQPKPESYTAWFMGLSSATQEAISTGIKKASEIGGPEFGKQFAQDIKNAIETGAINENIFASFQNSGIFNEDNSIFDIEKSKNKFIKDVQELGYTIDEAKFQWENLYAFSQSYGTINFKITTDAALEDMTNEVEDSLNTIVTSYDKVSSYLSTQLSEGGIDLSGFTALRDEVANIGLDIDNYVTGMQNGLYQINFDALTQAYHEQVDSQAITVEAVKAEIQARINAIDALLAENTSEVNLQNSVVDTTDAIWAQAEAMAEVANMAAKARAEQEGKPGSAAHYTVTRTNNVKKKTLSQEQRTALEQERDDLVDLMNNEKAMQEIADQRNAQQAAHAQISNKEADAIDKVTKANKSGSSAAKDAADAADKLREAQEKLNEALYGTENYKNAADHLANYTERLEELTEKADKAKESLENLGKEDSASELIATYTENVKLDNITRTAENQVLRQSMDDLLKILNEQYSEYFQKVGDTWMWNASVVDAKMNDHEKDFIIESIENLNEYQDKINENLDAIEEREKEFKEMRKTALDSRIALEEEVMDVLKENYQKEIDAAQEKYDALKEADDNYLDALEEAINKQRELRDRANEYEDLAQKERKLALKQRDTSGVNRKDTLQLQQEVEESRQDMLDNEVDRLLESMKEMYELQQESREAELEYMNAMVENGQLLQEANEIIASFNTREDMLAWFFENNQELADMSVAATEKYKMELEDMYDAAELYYAMSETNLEELTSFTQEEVADTVATIGETLTLEAERSYNEMRETVDKEVEDARKAVEDAAKSAADAVGGAASAIGSAADYIKSKYDEITNNSTNLFDIATPTATGLEEQRKGEAAAAKKQYENSYAGLKSAEYTKEANDKAKKIKAVKTTISNSLSSLSHNPNITYGGTFGKFELRIDGNKYTLPTDPFSAKSFGNSLKNIDESLYTIYNGSVRMSLRDYLNKVIPKKTGGTSSGGGGGGNYRGITKNKNGGLVDYTGLAWVDGTTTEPEAFLSADDTKRIGEAAKLLSNLPILNSTSSASTPLSTNIGDTSIEIHINVDSISSDYDVDRLAERIKSDIVDASKPVGTPVILKR